MVGLVTIMAIFQHCLVYYGVEQANTFHLNLIIFMHRLMDHLQLPHTRYYNPRLVYFLHNFLRPFLCFQGVFYQEILSLCMVSV